MSQITVHEEIDIEKENQRIIDEILHKKREPKDEKDFSAHPSYTNFQVPYHMKCRARFNQTTEMYEAQFQYEIDQIMQQHSSAYEVARLNRHMCITSLWPPLHNRRELMETQRKFFRLSEKQRKRLNYIMNTNII